MRRTGHSGHSVRVPLRQRIETVTVVPAAAEQRTLRQASMYVRKELNGSGP